MDQPTVDDEGSVREERVSPVGKARVRDALHVAVEIPVKFVIGFLLIGAFNGGVVWVKFDALVDSAKVLQASNTNIQNIVTRNTQVNSQQDEKLQDHESRLRVIERTKP